MNLTYYQNINRPIFAAISGGHEFTVIPVDQAVELLKRENPNAEVHKLENCEHSFQSAEDKIAEMIAGFITKYLA